MQKNKYTPPKGRNLPGLFAGGGAFLFWGLLPCYWKALKVVPAPEILCHRMFWSLVFVGAVITLWRRWPEVRAALFSRKNALFFLGSSSLLAVNWLTYIWGVNAGFVLDASMGYYINPLVNVLLGFIFFKDRLRRFQVVAILLAAAGVANLVINYGRFPWIALTLAFSFGLYGLIRKLVRVESLPGLFVESLFMSIPALFFLGWLQTTGQAALGGGHPEIDILLVGAGAVTAIPLLMFAFCARRLRLVEVGILQYLAPTCMFLLGVFAFGELFTTAHLITFSCIWTGIAIYTGESVFYLRRHPPVYTE
jgi:chloramphenicol-sensitive protein RarD